MSPSLSSPDRVAVAALLAVLALGCRHEEVPPLAASSDAPTVGTEVADDPVRQELRGLYAACELRREALAEELDHAERRYRRIAGAAAVAWIVGEIFGGHAPPGAVLTEPECTAPGGAGAGTSRCNPQTVRVAGADPAYDPAREGVRTVSLDARQQLLTINHAIDTTDTLLFAHPDVGAWTQEEWDRWEDLRSVLRLLCE